MMQASDGTGAGCNGARMRQAPTRQEDPTAHYWIASFARSSGDSGS